MPVRNVVRYLAPDTFYHVYNRGHNKDLLFADAYDYEFFLFLLARCFGLHQLKSQNGRLFSWFGDRVTISAFCLMPNHFHLLLHQGEDEMAVSKAMQSLATTYSMYFNQKYQKRGSIFESAFKSVPVLNDAYLQHITRYIHLNPQAHKQWAYSSYQDYLGAGKHHWVAPNVVLGLFDSTEQYREFVDDYVSLRDELATLKHNLADNADTYYVTNCNVMG